MTPDGWMAGLVSYIPHARADFVESTQLECKQLQHDVDIDVSLQILTSAQYNGAKLESMEPNTGQCAPLNVWLSLSWGETVT